MKTVIINLNITSVPRFRAMEIPCPRVNVFKDPIGNAEWLRDKWLTQAGNYNYSIQLEDGERCGIDVFAWEWNIIDITTDLSVDTKIAGDNLDQIQKHIDITEAGTYNISIIIN